MAEVFIISNTTGNHLDKLKALYKSATDRIVIVSPFLAANISALLKEFDFSGVNTLELITTFKPADAEQLTKPRVLKEFLDFFKSKYHKMKVKVHVDNHLHGKLYLSLSGNKKSLILSSANFTRSGLSDNHEWGLSLDDNAIIDTLVEEVFDSIGYFDVTYNQIVKACLFAEQYAKNFPDWTRKPNISSDILESVYSVDDTKNTEPKYFLKPIGHSDSPILLEEMRDFSDLHQNLHFSKRKPQGVRKGDYVITTAVGPGSLLSYFKVTGGLQHVTDDEIKRDGWKERWPWYMEGRNQSPEFGGQWWVHNIRRQDALNEFLQKHQRTPVTYAGGYGLGTINRGNDKVRITKEFGDFLISQIEGAIKENPA